jgi:hypothetical protein
MDLARKDGYLDRAYGVRISTFRGAHAVYHNIYHIRATRSAIYHIRTARSAVYYIRTARSAIYYIRTAPANEGASRYSTTSPIYS